MSESPEWCGALKHRVTKVAPRRGIDALRDDNIALCPDGILRYVDTGKPLMEFESETVPCDCPGRPW